MATQWVNVKATSLIDTLTDNLRQVKAEINLDTLGNVQAKALLNTMAKTLQEAKEGTPLDKMDHLNAETLKETLAHTLAEHKTNRHFLTHRGMWRPRPS